MKQRSEMIPSLVRLCHYLFSYCVFPSNCLIYYSICTWYYNYLLAYQSNDNLASFCADY